MSEQQHDPVLTPAYKPEVPDRTPRPSTVIAEPATPETCQADYADAADIRRRLGWK
ncbi:hypothetical protein ACPCAJ_21140 [Streptomyces griseoincarnatus]